MIVNSQSVNDNLPHSIQAFVMIEGSELTYDLKDGRTINVATAHQDFLRAYGLSHRQVPRSTCA